MAKAISGKIKLQIVAGQATPAPPVGPALGQYGVPIGDFVNKFNEATKPQMGTIVPVIITVYEDRSFDFIVKSPPASVLVKKAANLKKGSAIPNVDKVGSLTQAQLESIVDEKINDLNTNDKEAAKRIIAGTARSMGVTITD